jgi:hypothetical protein
MGTRGAVGFRANSKDKVQYNHMDSYPSYLGEEVLSFISKSSLQELKEIADNIVMVDSEAKPTDEQISECAKWTNLGVSRSSTDDWYCLLRQAQGNLDAYKNGLKYMLDAGMFLYDSLFCEFAYIINTDENVLEFYTGFNTRKTKSRGRYAFKTDPLRTRPTEYYGVAMVAKFPLEEIIGAKHNKIDEMVAKMQKKADLYRKSLNKEDE